MPNKKYKVEWSKKAEKSIINITTYIAEQGYAERTEKFYYKLEKFGNKLSGNPGGYAICRQEILARYDMRCAVFRKTYIFVYKVENNRVVIYNVIPGKTNPESWEI